MTFEEHKKNLEDSGDKILSQRKKEDKEFNRSEKEIDLRYVPGSVTYCLRRYYFANGTYDKYFKLGTTTTLKECKNILINDVFSRQELFTTSKYYYYNRLYVEIRNCETKEKLVALMHKKYNNGKHCYARDI